MEPSKLTDQQLDFLARHKRLSDPIALMVKKEIDKRGLPVNPIISHASDEPDDKKDELPAIEKILIVLFPFLPVIHAIIANRHISSGHINKWRQHWRYLTIGFLVWFILLIIFCIGYRILHVNKQGQYEQPTNPIQVKQG